MTAVGFQLRVHNPDVLTCIANLSNDEVATPPWLVDAMLDNLARSWAESNGGENIWANPDLRFLDPFTKTGVYLREVTRRLSEGLVEVIPDLQERVDHIVTRQVFGIAITQLTAHMSRRSVYCSKYANGRHSVGSSFTTPEGNIWFERTEHTWAKGQAEWRVDPVTGEDVAILVGRRCSYCGATEEELKRSDDLETHAYAFIHTDDISAQMVEFFGESMQFDVIIGNPPYQLNDGGFGTSAAPIYQHFVEQAKALDPRFLSLIIPSRWFTGGKYLDDFRESMLTDDRLRSIDDFLNAGDVFPGIGLKGGVCYFLWDRDNRGDCRVSTHFKDRIISTVERPLLENGVKVFIRFNEGVDILQKVSAVETGSTTSLGLPDHLRFDRLVSARKPFGLTTTFRGKSRQGPNDVKVYQKDGVGFIARSDVPAGAELIDKWKVFVGRAAPGTGKRDTYPHMMISTPFLGEPGSISSETYLAIGPFETEVEANSALSYLSCRLPRFLILLHKASQDTTRRVYTFVPTQDWTQIWTDEALYAKYGLNDDEIAFIEEIVRPMEIA